MSIKFDRSASARGSSHWGAIAIAFVLAMLLSRSPLKAGSIFDDNWTPPKPAVPPAPATAAVPPVQVPQPESPPVVAPPTPNPAPVTPVAPSPAVPNIAAPARREIPAPADQAKSRKLFKELFAADLADHTPEGRRALAAKLLAQLATVGDVPSDRFVLLSGVIDAATEGADLGLCCKAADLMAESYDVDALRIESDSALKMTLHGATAAATADNCRIGLKLVDEQMAADDCATAARLLQALRMAAPEAEMVREIQARTMDLETLRVALERVAPYLQKLKTAPDDAQANLQAGRFYCLVKNDWPRGLPFLVKSGDAAFIAAAANDLNGAADPQKQADIGGAWWDLAEKEMGPAQAALHQRAKHWYSMALKAGLEQGLQRALVEKRLAAVPVPPPVEKHMAAVPVTPPGATALQPGLVGQLYAGDNFSELFTKRIDRQIYFEFGVSGPATGMAGRHFSIRWTGLLKVPKTANYTWFADVDDVVHLEIDRQTVLLDMKIHQASLRLVEGLHPITIEYRNTAGPGHLKLKWEQENGFSAQGLDRDALWHDPSAGHGAEAALRGWRSDLVDRAAGTPFRDDAPPGMVLVGLELTDHEEHGHIAIKSVRAPYMGERGEAKGKQIGQPAKGMTVVIAKPGYAVAAIQVNASVHIDGLSLRFMRMRNGHFDPRDAYESPHFGDPAARSTLELGEGTPIIGLYGTADADCYNLGVITPE